MQALEPKPVQRLAAFELGAVVRRRRPAVLTGLLRDEPRLSLQELGRRWGPREVPVAPIVDGAVDYTARGGVPFRHEPLGALLDRLDRPDAGMVSGRPQDWLPGIEARLPRLEPPGGAPWQRSRIWIAPAGAVTPLHHEVTHNLLAQLEGDKEVTLYRPRARRAMYPNSAWSRMPHTSRVAAQDPDPAQHPRFLRAQPYRAEMSPGDVLFIPALWWHWVRAVDVSLSYNLWFAGGPVAMLARALEGYKHLRALRL